MTKVQGKERIPYWDNIKGILIVLVVSGHFLWDYWGMGFTDFLVSFIYFFHMPAFVFVSGFLSKSEHSRSMQAIFKMFVVYIIFNTAIMIFSSVLLNSSYQLITPYYSFWFLISLIVWRLTIKYIEKIKNILLVSIIVAILVGLWSDVTNVLAISRTIVFYPFFIIGYKLSANKINNFIYNRKLLDYFKGILLLLCTICISNLFIYKYTGLTQSNLLMERYSSISDLFVRITMLVIAGLMITSMVILTPQKPLPFLCKWGRNSLVIYVLHRFVSLVFIKVFPASNYNKDYVTFAFFASIITLLILGSNIVSNKFNWMINKITNIFSFSNNNQDEHKKNIFSKMSAILLITCLSLPILIAIILAIAETPGTKNNSTDIMHEVMTNEQKAELKDAMSIAFVGDLILLKDQVEKAYSNSSSEYEFNSMFKYVKKYLTEADFAIGIFEGPTAGKEAGYSTSNYDDGEPLYLNYPDSFARTVKDSGIDLVSTANNHLLDKGEKGAMRTLDVLDEVGLLHVGSYRNAKEKDSIMIIEKKGVRIAILAYTFGSNGYNDKYFLKENTSLTSILVEPNSRYFKDIKSKVLSDFQKIKDMKNPPDLIAVIPHMGSQFIHNTDAYQDTWNNIFIKAGANIILGDHSHAVQPIVFRTTVDDNGKEKRAIIVNSPGNFVNSYVKNDGDATSIVEIYINPKSKEIICASIIPMYTQLPSNGNYRALPIYDILHDTALQNEVDKYEMKRVTEVQAIVTSVMIGTKLTLDQAQERYYLFPEGYVRQTVRAIEITGEMKETDLYRLLCKSKKVCFVGDSITAGTKNGGYGWYEPLMAAFSNNIVYKEAWGGATTQTLLDKFESIANSGADLYIIAIGTNDIRYRDNKICAMDANSYIENVNSLIVKILNKNQNVKFVLISPWLALDNDPYTKLSPGKRDLMLEDYGEALKSYCENKGYCFINPNPSINEIISKYTSSYYLIDHIHPNASTGIILYSEKVLGYKKGSK